jgi:hypothetical protein
MTELERICKEMGLKFVCRNWTNTGGIVRMTKKETKEQIYQMNNMIIIKYKKQQ